MHGLFPLFSFESLSFIVKQHFNDCIFLTGNCVQNNSLSCEARRSCLLSSIPKQIIELHTAQASWNIFKATITQHVLRIKYIALKSIIQLPMR